MNQPAHSRRHGATLIETLLTITLIVMMTGLTAVAIGKVRERANRTLCHIHLKDLVLAIHSHQTSLKKMPPYASGRPKEMHGGWYMHLLPFVGRGDLYDFLRANQRKKHGNITVFTTGEFMPETRNAVFADLACASDPTRSGWGGNNRTNYLANWYALTDGVRGTYRQAQRLDSLTNGLSNVVLLAEAYSECNKLSRVALYSANYHNFGITQEGLPSDDKWYAPKDYLMFQDRPAKCDRWRTQMIHDVMHVALADGSVRNVAPSISPATWKHVVKARTDGQPGADW